MCNRPEHKSSLMALPLFLLLATITAKPAMASGPETDLLKFSFSADGFFPQGSLVTDGTNLYGTTSANLPNYGGVVFQLTPPPSGIGPWTENVLYAFTGGSDGYEPQAGLVRDASGNLYGTTAYGGVVNAGCCGTVFELSPPSQPGGSWTETTLYQFKGGNDGAHSLGTLIMDRQGNLYGTTLDGGQALGCCGTAFELSPPATKGGAWMETVLHDFSGGNDGQEPEAGLYLDPLGRLFGTTYFGGTSGAGTVFELTQSLGVWSERVLYSFSGGADGGEPASGVVGYNGALYGTTVLGGAVAGTVFQLTEANGKVTEKVIYAFQDGSDGGSPYSGVVVDANGNLYGATANGGDNNLCRAPNGNGCGVVYELAPPSNGGSWSQTVLYSFDGADGYRPVSPPLLSHQALWGVTLDGGAQSCGYGCGVVYRVGL